MPKPGKAGELAYPAPETAVLANGLTLWVVRRQAEVASLSLVVRHGASSVPKGKSGLAALTARMLTEGTKKRSSLALAEASESLGATLGHDAGRDYSSVGLSTLVSDLPRALELLAEVVQTPAFSEKEFDRVRREWVDALVAERQSPDRLASLAGLRLLLGEPEGAPVNGSVPDVEKLTVKDLVGFHKSYYSPKSSAVIVVGNVGLAEMKSAVEKSFGAWFGAQPPAPPKFTPLPPTEKTRLILIDRPEAVQTAIFVAQPFPNRTEAGYEARELMDNALGGLFTSRINHNLREQHAYTYGARSDAIATRRWGAFVVSTSVETPVTADAMVELVNELKRAKDPKLGAPFTDEEIARSRADLINSLGAHLEHTDKIGGDFESAFTLGLPPRYFSDYAASLVSIGKDRVATESQRLEPERLLIVVVGERNTIEPGLRSKGFAVESPSADLTL
jgi:zinc protease